MPLDPRERTPRDTTLKELKKELIKSTVMLPEVMFGEMPEERITKSLGFDERDENTIEAILKEVELLEPYMTESEKETVMSTLLQRIKKEARKDFYIYVRLMSPLILPEGYKDGRHIRKICDLLQSVERDTRKGIPRRVMVFMPPGSMKSKLLNLFVTWCFGRNPKWNVLHIGYATQFAEDNFGRPIRDIVRSPEYQDLFPNAILRSDSKAAGRMDLIEGGKYFATGVNAQIAGRRAHLAICDDPISEQTAYSDIERTKVNNWYGPGLRTRLLPNGSEIVVNTRYHLDDLSGALLHWDEKSKIPWEVIKIPAILDRDSAKNLGLEEGGSFWPELWPLDVLLEKRNSPTMSEAKWNALYMQNPVPEEGNILKEEYFRKYTDDEPEILTTFMSVDTAFSQKKTADYSAYSIWGVFIKVDKDIMGKEIRTANMLLLESNRGRWDFPTLCENIQTAYDFYAPDVILIENKASGQSLIQEFERRQLPVHPYEPDRDKVSRVHACVPFFKSGRIWVPADKKTNTTPKWVQELIIESLQFPFGSHDDLVDTMSQAILFARDSYQVSNPNYPKGYNEDELDEDDKNELKRKRFSKRNNISYWNLTRGRA